MQYARQPMMSNWCLVQTNFQYKRNKSTNMAHLTALESAITEILSLIIRYKEQLCAEDVEERASIKAQNLSNVEVALHFICDKVGVEQIKKWLIKFSTMKCLWKKCNAVYIMLLCFVLEEMIIDEGKQDILTEVFEKQFLQLFESKFPYYAMDAFIVLKKQFSLGDMCHLRTTVDYECRKPNFL